MRRQTFTVAEGSSLCCARCGRRLSAGDRATVTRSEHFATYRHAGRDCPRFLSGAALARRLMLELRR